MVYECNELRFTLANALLSARSSLGLLDQATVDLLKPVLLEYNDVLERQSIEVLRKVFAKPDKDVILGLTAAQASRTDAFGQPYSAYPMPCSLPLLAAHIGELDLFPIAQQQVLLRADAELHLFNEQVAYVRVL